MNERKRALDKLISFALPVESCEDSLAAFPWDSSAQLTLLSSEHILNVLNQFVNGSASAADVEKWANAIEGRDDIGFEAKAEKILSELIYEMANPLLTRALTRERAFELIQNLAAKYD